MGDFLTHTVYSPSPRQLHDGGRQKVVAVYFRELYEIVTDLKKFNTILIRKKFSTLTIIGCFIKAQMHMHTTW